MCGPIINTPLLGAGHEELVPANVVDHLLAGDNPLVVWREYRQIKPVVLVERVGISTAFLSQLESGAREGKIYVWREFAAALDVILDDLLRA